ncbi:t-SNARE [Lepidopterella palustris CBS 459.81]|uniref:t-SNARE n=1 Tax=Lepidopterella palustris CBS 459.81 TaxID=1314670 RepID=A0A8E2EEJ1_9PEZI|nr:t-SNARE [Lepidopterella palustris CBS 459.81]
MSYGGYQQYGGNPYGGQSGEGGYGASNPYGGGNEGVGGYGASNPYGGPQDQALNPPPLQQQTSNYSQGSQYSTPAAPIPAQQSAPLSDSDFLARIEGAKSRINQLTTNISSIANIHQRMLSSPDSSASAQLENLVTQTQIQNTGIKDEIKYLEKDASRSPGSTLKKTQVETLKRNFAAQLQDYRKEEQNYEARYKEAIGRQYRIVNPEATEEEVQEATNADWGNEGVFQTALKSNRSGQASSVLGAVRARHNDIQRIEKTLGELALLFQQLDEQVVYQEQAVVAVEDQTNRVKDDTENANVQLDKGIVSARRARKLKWWTLLTVVAIIIVLGLILGLYFGLHNNNNSNNNSNKSNNGA